MNAIQTIRKKIGVTQAEFAAGIGVSQGNVSHYENGQTVPPVVGSRIIKYAKEKGVVLSFDDLYRPTAVQ